MIATGENFPDSLTAVPLAKKYDPLILLTNKDSMSIGLQAELSRLKVKHASIFGGTGVISDNISNQLIQMGISVE